METKAIIKKIKATSARDGTVQNGTARYKTYRQEIKNRRKWKQGPTLNKTRTASLLDGTVRHITIQKTEANIKQKIRTASLWDGTVRHITVQNTWTEV